MTVRKIGGTEFGVILQQISAGYRGLDAFGRLPVSNPTALANYQVQYDNHPLFWEESTSGSGAAAHNADDSSVDLSIGAADDTAIRQTRLYHRYQPGKSQLILTTFAFESAGTLHIVKRSKSSGVVVDTAVAQADWNAETFTSGSDGPLDTTLDATKTQIFFIDLEWLGVGTVRTGFVIQGQIVPAHVFHHANVESTTYMTTANLPVRYEIINTGGVTYKRVGYFDGENGIFLEHRSADTSTTFKTICASVMSEGGFETARGIPVSASNGISQIAVTTRRPVLSIRPKATFNSIVNRAEILIRGADVFANTEAAFIEIVYDGTLTGASFASAGANSVMEYDVAATAISGGLVVNSFFVAASSQGSQNTPGAATLGLLSRLPLCLDIAGANPKNLTLVATAFQNTSNVSGSLSWQELR